MSVNILDISVNIYRNQSHLVIYQGNYCNSRESVVKIEKYFENTFIELLLLMKYDDK